MRQHDKNDTGGYPTLGLVLCGGQSTRMGQDKGLMGMGGQTWAARQLGLLAKHAPAKLAINHGQLAAYQAHFAREMLVADQPHPRLNGPLRGLLSVHAQAGPCHVVVVPCDMVALPAEEIDALTAARAHHTDALAIVPVAAGYPQPLVAFYRAEGLQKLHAAAEAGRLDNLSMRQAISLDFMHTHFMARPVPASHYANFNRPEDLPGWAKEGREC